MKTIYHKFVEYIPDAEEQDNGVVYITITYNTAVHKCFCGCEQQVVTPLSPNDWSLTYDGERISLYPSIGNWSYECRSHYWIKKGKLVWAEKWSDNQILKNRESDQRIKKDYYMSKVQDSTEKKLKSVGLIKRLIRKVFK